MLSVSSGAGRSRSKSPGRIREHSRTRAESPPKPKPSSRSKKYYEPSSDSEELTETDSEDDRQRRRGSTRKDDRYERDDKHGRREKEDDKKYRRRRDEESETESDDSEDDRKYDKYDRRRDSEHDRRRDSEHDRYKKEYADGRHPSYAEGGRYEYAKARPEVAARHQSYSERSSRDMPGAFEEYEEPRDKRGATRHMSYVEVEPGSGRTQKVYQDGSKYVAVAPGTSHYAAAPRYEYAQQPQEIKYISKNDPRARDGKEYYTTAKPVIEERKLSRTISEDKYSRRKEEDDRRKPSRRDSEKDSRDKHKSRKDDSSDERDKRGKYKSHKDDSSDDDRRKSKHKSRKDDSSDDDRRKPSRKDSDYSKRKDGPQVLEIRPGGAGQHRLSVSGLAPGGMMLVAPGQQMHMAGALPPGSPLLEAYHGTYQSISPMPSPMALPTEADDGLSDLDPLEGDFSSDDSHHNRNKSALIRRKKVEIYDPEPDALAIAAELKHSKPTTKPLIKILPLLSDDNMMALRTEYKKHFKVNGKGINVAKHIKLKLTNNAGKAAYATALGRWESEAHWANFWYQSGSSRRELLIESLIGRSNLEIRKIKDAFNDKRYNDSLEKCMQAELKKDKFRNAVMLALQEKRQEELAPLSRNLITEDVRNLYKALVSKDGGETAMIEIIVVRSDLHLRQVLQEFEAKYKQNFAREMIRKSQNLVGETLAHILNGVLNRPVRDAMLLRQALAETSKDRAELLISRLVRYHWEPKHLLRIKLAYKQKYGTKLDDDIEKGVKGEFGEFCLALCEGATK